MTRRQSGSIRKRPSGRYQARYTGPDGQTHNAPNTFERKTDAAKWLSAKETEIMRGEWINPDAGQVAFEVYAKAWIGARVLKTRTRELYDGLLRNHLLPTFGAVPLADRPFGPVTVAKAYRLLHAILETATGDELIRRNPARIDGAGNEDSREREIIPLPLVFDIMAKLPARYRALVLMATFTQLRFGELAGLRRDRLDLDAYTVQVTEASVQPDRGSLLVEPPKSRAALRTVTFPAAILPDLRDHLKHYAETGPSGLVFTGPKGGTLRRNNFNPVWSAAVTAVGLPDAHFHDLRHTGGTLAAITGATTKEPWPASGTQARAPR
jgi:integrase